MKDIDKIINKYGRTVCTVDSHGKILQSTKCFIQALCYKNKMYIEGIPTEIGINDSGYYRFLGPAEISLASAEKDGYLSDGEKHYHVDRWEKIYMGKNPVFVWAVLKDCSDGNYPEYNHFA